MSPLDTGRNWTGSILRWPLDRLKEEILLTSLQERDTVMCVMTSLQVWLLNFMCNVDEFLCKWQQIPASDIGIHWKMAVRDIHNTGLLEVIL